MSKSRVVAVGATAALVSFGVLAAAGAGPGAPQPAQAVTVPGANLAPEVRAMLAAVDPARIAGYDWALVSFRNRNTLSAQHDPNEGIGAARDYLYRQFRAAAARSGAG